MKSIWSTRTLAAALVFLLNPFVAQAHLGIVRLRAAQGPFVITVFTSPALVRRQAGEVSVLVQRRDSKDAILDAAVNFVLTPPRGAILDDTDPICGRPMTLGATLWSQGGRAIIPARRERSLNKLLYAAEVDFPLTGVWELEIVVRQGADSAKLACEIPVGLPARRLAGLVPSLALPLVLVALFAINQWLRVRYASPVGLPLPQRSGTQAKRCSPCAARGT